MDKDIEYGLEILICELDEKRRIIKYGHLLPYQRDNLYREVKILERAIEKINILGGNV